MRFILTRKVKNILYGIFAVLLVLFLAMGVVSFTKSIVNKNDDYKKVSLNWEIGGLTSTGKYTETKKSIYTKESFNCDGLITELDFDSNIKYQVFFYDEKDVFISSTDVLSESKEHVIPENAELARIVITPIWGADVAKKDQVIKWHDNWILDNKYSKQLTVKVLVEELLSFEVEKGIYKITATNLDGDGVSAEEVTLHNMSHTALTNKYWDRLYLQYSDGLGFYGVIDSAIAGTSNLDISYDYILGIHESCTDDLAVEFFEFILENNPDEYIVHFVEKLDGSIDIYFTLETNSSDFSEFIEKN